MTPAALSIRTAPAGWPARLRFVVFTTGFGALSLRMSLDRWVLPVSRESASGWGVAYAPILTVLAIAIGAGLYAGLAPRTQQLRLGDTRVMLSRGRFGRRPVRIPYHRIRSVAFVRVWPWRRPRLVVTTPHGVPRSFRTDWFAREADIVGFARALEHRAAAAVDDGARADALRARAELADVVDSRSVAVSTASACGVVACFGVQAWIGAFDWPGLLWFGAATPWLIAEGEWQRGFTAVVTHAGLVHVVVNAVMLVAVGQLVERLIGGWRLVVVLWVAALSGSLAVLWEGEQGYVGASGAGFGLLGALLALNVTDRRSLPAPYFVSWILILVLVGVSAALERLEPRMGTAVHIGGLIGGAFATLAMRPGLDLRSPKPRTPRVVKGLAVTMAALFFAALGTGAWTTHTSTRSDWLRRSALHFAVEEGSRPWLAVSVHALLRLPDPPRDVLEAVRPALRERAARRGGLSAGVAAEVEYRLGALGRAIALQALYMTGSGDDQGLATLAAMRAEAREAGPATAPSNRSPAEIRWREDGRIEGVLPAARVDAEGFVLDLLVLEAGVLRGALRISGGRHVGTHFHLGDRALAEHHDRHTTELVAVDLRPRVGADRPRVGPNQVGSWYRAIAPDESLLYAPIPDR